MTINIYLDLFLQQSVFIGPLDPHLMDRNWQYYLLVLLGIEKTIQHIFVTYAFAIDLSGIRSEMQFDYRFFMYSGIFIAILFAFATYYLGKMELLGVKLMFLGGWIDFIGEFIGQGIPLEFIPVSFIVAIIIILVSWTYYRGQGEIREEHLN